MGDLVEFRKLILFAIEEERKAQRLYKRMGSKIKDPFGRAILEGLYEEEVGHEERLKSLLDSIQPLPKSKKRSGLSKARA